MENKPVKTAVKRRRKTGAKSKKNGRTDYESKLHRKLSRKMLRSVHLIRN